MDSRELYSIREWAPLTDVLDRIPTRIKRGLFLSDLNITCIDALEQFFALGSDAGTVFWYNRSSGQVQKLKSDSMSRITCVKVVDSVDYMVAAGNSAGEVFVFQIAKDVPPDINLVGPCTRPKPIERYAIRDMHQNSISCCEWSKNGMKLYSGDRQGVVVLTEFDYHEHISKSAEILNEAYEIVQMSAHKGYLLVSSLYRSIVCHRLNGAWVITQIGKKDRKQLIDCGGTFLKEILIKNTKIICGRPNLRFWLADIEGNVEKTLLFREAIARSPTWEIPMLNPKSLTLNKAQTKVELPTSGDVKNFRNIYAYAGKDSLIVTHDESELYVLNLDSLQVEAVAKGFRKIIDFCVCGKEIFILEGQRTLLRLAPMPEKPNKTARIIYNPTLPPPVPLLSCVTNETIEAPVEYEPEEHPVVKAEECFELPPVEPLNLKIPIELAVESPRAEQSRRLEMFKEISEMDFDEHILHHSGVTMKTPHKKKHKNQEIYRKTAATGIVEIGHAIQADEQMNHVNREEGFITKSTRMEASYCSDNGESCTPSTNLKEAFAEQMPNMLSPTSLKHVVEEKAKLLAETLDLPVVNLQPISDEDMRLSRSMMPSSSFHSSQLSTLDTAYPGLKDTSMQTTPLKKIYYIEEQTITDYSSGEPVEDICHTLRATTLVENRGQDAEAVEEMQEQEQVKSKDKLCNRPLKFISTKPDNDYDVKSFLLNFDRAKDPIAPRKSPPHTNSDNSSSSEWEFVDNN
uniref:WD repeat-containing protein CG11141 n=1 Tax=Glossina brevipalpis TaxID=37001 RepID=A0A1A9WR45_9MUSC